ncbi:MAG: glycosyltransferase family 39 protein [Candidatus Omnitrophica bacterium]|nr:glycosyltransferase family 39 protein [Candidatus Omnitrophota bacterium]
MESHRKGKKFIAFHLVRAIDSRTTVLFFIFGMMSIAGLYSYLSRFFIPLIHDEMSYLLQAETFLRGRIANPTHPEHLFFDAFHVINEGIYASVYFPGFGLTLAPFVLLGIPYANPITIYGLHLLLIYAIGFELFDRKTAWLALFLTAVSPAIFVQTALLLSHLSCATSLLVFFLAYVKLIKNGSARWGLILSSAWGFAFLTRPITAIGFIVPFAIHALIRLFKKMLALTKVTMAAILLPLATVVCLFFIYNKTVTGSYFKTPYGLYFETHAPYRHNGSNAWEKSADQAESSSVHRWFNEHYPSHLPKTVILNILIRTYKFVEWLFGSTWAGLLAISIWWRKLFSRGAWHILLFSVWICLQLAYAPHWYAGITVFGATYLTESIGLVVLGISNAILTDFQSLSKKLPRVSKYIGLAGLVICIMSSIGRLSEAREYMISANEHQLWINQELKERDIKKAVLFIKHPENYTLDRDFIRNDPDFKNPIIFARDRGNENIRLLPYFPNYEFYLVDLENRGFISLPFR